MPWKSLFKGIDSSPATPKITPVSLPSFDDSPSPPKARVRTSSILKGAHVPPQPAAVKLPPSRPTTPAFQTPSRPITPAFNRTRAHSISSSTTSSSSDASTFFRIEPATPRTRCSTPRPPSRATTPVVTVVPPTPKPFPVVEEDEVVKPPRTKPRSASYPATAYVKPVHPPPPQPQPHPQPQPQSPPQHQGQPDLHWQLLPYEKSRGKPYLHFDIQYQIDSIRLFGSTLRPLGQDDRRKPAANAPLTRMTIRCGQLPMWEVDVRCRDGRTLTCADVFDAIYDTYHQPVTEAEKARLPAEFLEGCEPYFQARCRLSSNNAEAEERRGLRRVDLLRGRTIFRGLTCPTPGKGYWVIHLDRPRAV